MLATTLASAPSEPPTEIVAGETDDEATRAAAKRKHVQIEEAEAEDSAWMPRRRDYVDIHSAGPNMERKALKRGGAAAGRKGRLRKAVEDDFDDGSDSSESYSTGSSNSDDDRGESSDLMATPWAAAVIATPAVAVRDERITQRDLHAAASSASPAHEKSPMTESAVVRHAQVECERIKEEIESRLRASKGDLEGFCIEMSTAGGSNGLFSVPPHFGEASGRTLKSWQIVGMNWLMVMYEMRLGGILADDMGLGKTAQVISLLATLAAAGEQGPHLVVAPASVLDSWMSEFDAWVPHMRVVKYHGSLKERSEHKAQLDYEGFDVLVTTYSYFEGDNDACRRDRAWLGKREWCCCVLDEAHALKRADSARTRNLSRIPCEQRLLLTGTPVQNNLAELLSLLSFMLPEVFTSDVVDAFGQDETCVKVQRVRRMLAPFVLRRSKDSVLSELPPKHEVLETIRQTPAQEEAVHSLLEKARSYKERGTLGEGVSSIFFGLRNAAVHPLLLRRHYDDALLDEIAPAAAASGIYGPQATRKMVRRELADSSDFQLHQLCCELPKCHKHMLAHEAIVSSGKFQWLQRRLPELLEEGHRVLLFSQSTQLLDILEDLLGPAPGLDIPYLRLDGNTPVKERQSLINDFQCPGSEIGVFLLSTRAGGLGITLTKADTVILHDMDWNPAPDRQAIDRAHRIGQERPVHVYRLLTEGTIDETIYSLQAKKTVLDTSVLGEKKKGRGKAQEDATEGPSVAMMTELITRALARDS